MLVLIARANNEGSIETAHMYRPTWAFAALIQMQMNSVLNSALAFKRYICACTRGSKTSTTRPYFYMSQCMRFPSLWYVRPAKPQMSLRIRAVWSEPLLIAWVFYDCYASDWTPFGVSKLKRRLHRLVWVYTFQNATLLEISCHGSYFVPTLASVLFQCTCIYRVSNRIICLTRSSKCFRNRYDDTDMVVDVHCSTKRFRGVVITWAPTLIKKRFCI